MSTSVYAVELKKNGKTYKKVHETITGENRIERERNLILTIKEKYPEAERTAFCEIEKH